ncbi:hypothetical protein [Mycobacterium sp.]|jgi:hypothetical protein|uniref:hypothetical protein n=1 Tax=Mycobacterium sp. TaxID=1785 RepID=UPI002D2A7E71|nr:hypothetical protein [Mycobacterium sp.]HZA08443.1 hypothetical protein [Mycobacterium sp.]
MSRSSAPIRTLPAGIITHTIAAIRGAQDGDITVHHARTPLVRMVLTWGGIMMTLSTADAAQGLLEAFAAARAKAAWIPPEIPAARTELNGPFAKPVVAIDWTGRPSYAVVPQSAPSKCGANTVRWVDLHTGPITWQIRDHKGLHSALELLTRAHRTAIAVCTDGEQFSADPTADDYPAVAS